MINLTNVFRLFQFSRQPNNIDDENILVENEVKAIELLQTMQWSTLRWDDSWKEIIEIDSLLPKVGKKYPIKLEDNEYYAQEGKAYFLWLPPHSELNGWYDIRPSEILKSYILEGTLSNPSLNYEKREYFFDFQILERKRLIDFFFEALETKISPLYDVGQIDGSSKPQWQEAKSLQKYNLGDYLYLTGVESETYLELILSYDDNRLCVHYSAVLPMSSNYETIITRYYLNYEEQELIENVVGKATKIKDDSMAALESNQIYGAEYW